jgi:non-ribosomal peptide synthetase component F/aryl carrier-like protein
MGVNFMDLTPTVASLLQPSDVPGVKGLCLAGEAITKENIKVWGPALDLQCCYGPSECTIYCTWNGDLEGSSEPTNIGRSIGSVSWLVDPSDHNVLQPIGCIGEILVEGPILARGYLNDPKKTFESFIFDPKWAQGGGRRMYKTGDLGRYNSDGTITYLGRRDTQVKLNGQRLELGEIEYHVKANLPAGAHSAVELVRIGDPQTGIKALATFVSFGSSSSVPASRQDWQLLPFTDSLQSIAENLAVALTKSLPGYMVPTLFLPTPSMPMTASGKLDRRQLRKQCESLSQEQAAIYRLGKQSSRALSTTMEVKFQGLWESVLKLKPGSVKADDTFFQLGGDSIGAMRLVTAARLQGISISVAEILQNPRLADFAAKAGSAVVPDDTLNSGPQAFSLLSPSELLTKHIASECRVSMESIQDAYPCSPLQEGLIALSTKSPGAYVAQNVYQLPSDINLDRFKKAWEMVFEHESMLRTRVVHTKEHGFLQVVVRDSPSWNRVSSEEELDRLRKLPPHNGGILSQYTIVGDNTDHPQFVWTAHHALYDSWCIPLLFRKVEALYNDIQSVDVASNVPYSRFIKYLSEINVTASDDFWKARLSGTTAVSFPPLPHPAYQVRATSISKYNISLSHGSRRNITLPSIIRAAWALVIGVYSGSAEDVVFGEILSGRDASVPGIADMVGPTITTVPTRIRIGPDVSIAEFLEDVQAQSAEMLPFQHSGLQHIKRISDDTAIACSFQNLLSITVNNGEMPNSLCEFQSSGTAGSNFSSYPLAILCGVEDGGAKIGIDCHYDEGAISIWQVERILGQFEFFLHRLNSNTGMNEKLGQISILNSTDQVTIQNWNSAPLKHVDKCIHDIIESQVDLQPASKTAIDSYDISLTYSELGQLSTRLAQYIVEQRLECDIIPFCFEKSAWAIVAMLAVMKSGRAFVPLDPAAPLARLRDITGDTEANFILCSAGYQALCQSLVPCAVVVNQQTIKRLPSYNCKLPRCNSSSPAYVIFTSGSTGKPKYVIS